MRLIISTINYINTHRSLLMQVAMVCIVLALSPLLGLLITRTSPILIVLAIIAPVIFFTCIRPILPRPELGPLIILISATLTSWQFSRGITIPFVLTGLFIGLWIKKQLEVNSRLGLIGSPVMPAVLTFILITIISWPWSKLVADPLLIQWGGGSQFEIVQAAQLAVIVLSGGALILTANLITTKKQLQLLVYAFLGFTSVGICLRLLSSPFQLNISGLTSTWAASLLYGQLLFNNKLSKLQHLVFIILISLWIYDKFFLGVTWLSGWVPVILAMFITSYLRSKKLFFLLIIIIAIAIFYSYGWWTEIFAAEDAESGNRFDKWDFLFSHHVVLGHWLLGTGPFGYAMYFMTYFPDNAASTHSNYIDIFLQFGIVGFLAFVWILGAVAWQGYKLSVIRIEDGFIDGFVKSTVGSFVAVVFAMTLGDWFTPFVLNQGLHAYTYTVGSWIFFGALCAVPVILKNEQIIQGKNKADV